ncbi:MAG: PorT family protein [Fibrobacter sp.]|nr:PorT family protein [Fibrobacter sp.]
MQRLIAVLILWFSSFVMAGFGNFDIGARGSLSGMRIHTDGPNIYSSEVAIGDGISLDLSYRFNDIVFLHSGVGVDYRKFSGYAGDPNKACFCPAEGPCDPCDDGNGNPWKIDKFWFMEIPLFIQARSPTGSFIEGGLVFDVLMDHRTERRFIYESGEKESLASHTNKFGANIAVAMGNVFPSGFFVDFRLMYRLNDLVEAHSVCTDVTKTVWYYNSWDDVTEVTEQRRVYSATFYRMLKVQLGVGYWF